ncbi:MAG TPA: TetR family transcriptional regulator [Thermoleophilia bacterium]|nr:TetR family transcriptional regulator [Thermoleophilia bacterium]
MRALTIGDLETESGTVRSTIYYYVRAGLLPPPQKSSPTRALYTDVHVELLRDIRRLKGEGLDLETVRRRLEPQISAASRNGEDLVKRQGEATRRAILETAAREFAAKGYRQTRIADILSELGITPQVLYSYFPTKRDLFAASYRACLDASMSIIEPRVEAETDPAVHLIWRMLGDYSLRALNPDLLYLARRAAYDDPETTRELRKAHEHILGNQERDLARLRPGPDDPPLSDELMSYGLFGAFQTMRMRASWDGRFSRSDVMWNNIALFLAVLALYDGTLDVEGLRRKYAHLIDEVASMPPPSIPGFDQRPKGRKGSR